MQSESTAQEEFKTILLFTPEAISPHELTWENPIYFTIPMKIRIPKTQSPAVFTTTFYLALNKSLANGILTILIPLVIRL